MTEVKSLRDANHSYAGADQNYFAPGNQQDSYFPEFASWEEYTNSDYFESDLDYNLMYRFDWKKEGESYPEKEHIKFFYVQQRRGLVAADTIFVTAEDEPAVRAYLQKYADHMRDLWAPLDLSPVAE